MTDVTTTPEDDDVTIIAAGASLVGQVRAANEDSFMIAERVVAVADGMGGHAAGEVASGIAVDTIIDAGDLTSITEVVNAVHNANNEIFSRSLSDAKQRGMGTTLCVAALVDDSGPHRLAIANVGDSRIYLLADGAIQQLTEDHSLVETLVREGRLTHAEASVHPQKNVLTRALGVDYEVLIDIWQLDARSGDRLLLCSDGLFNEVSDDDIGRILTESATPTEAVSALTETADAAGGRDNITAVVADIVIPGGESEPLGSRLKWIGATTGAKDGHRSTADDTATVPVIVQSSSNAGDTVAQGADPDGSEDDNADPDLVTADSQDPNMAIADATVDADALGATNDLGESSELGESSNSGDATGADGSGPDSGRLADGDAEDLETAPSQSKDQAADLSEADDEADAAADEGAADGAAADLHSIDGEEGDVVASDRSPRWRATAFVLAIVLVLAAVAGVLIFYARDGWTVRAKNGSIVMHSGRFESLPLIGDSRSEPIEGLREEDLSESIRRRIDNGEHFGTKAEANRFIDSLRSEQAPKGSDSATTTTTTSTTTASTTTSTTTPNDPSSPTPPSSPAPADPATPAKPTPPPGANLPG